MAAKNVNRAAAGAARVRTLGARLLLLTSPGLGHSVMQANV